MATDGSILILNSGSSSIKFALFDATPEQPRVFSGAIERIGLPRGRFHAHAPNGEVVIDETVAVPDHVKALSILLPVIEQHQIERPIAAAGHRVVHGGSAYVEHQAVTPDLLAYLRENIELAPLHLPGNLAGIDALCSIRPGLPQYACFDTAFHSRLPRVAQITGLPRYLLDRGLRRFGFHGLSYEYVCAALRMRGADVRNERIIIAHLGNGASMCAVKGGTSVETTMGFSTLPGLLMGTRPGDVDAGLLLHLAKREGLCVDELTRILYEKSGLLGVSGASSDMRELLGRAHEPSVAEALELYCYRARYHLAALSSVLGGLDRVVFTGGIGAHASTIRARICANLDYLGIRLDAAANESGATCISARDATVIVEVMLSDEEAVAAGHVMRLSG